MNTMEILFYRYDSIYESSLIRAFERFGLTVREECSAMRQERDDPAQTARVMAERLEGKNYLFVFSINFFPTVSDVCEIYNTVYVSWTVDVPVMELFSPSVRNRCNRIFCFDRAQYETFFDENPQGFFHLPLGTDWRRSEKAIREAAKEKKSEYRGDIAFVGSLYTEKNPYRMIRGISDRSRGYIDGICNCAIQVYGANIIESLVTDEIADELEPLIPDMQLPIVRDNAKARRYMIVNEFINMEASVREREGILRSLAEHFELDLYTNSKVSSLGKVHCHPAVKTFTEMPVVFHESRINLNITMRSITSGIPMRVFDICGCGGFCLTNWQEELPELYEPGVEIESYASEEELIDKADFYLRNETARARIAQNGWKRTQESHTCEARVAEMIRILSDTFGGDTGRV